jgi:hypothetical protein
MGFHPIPQFWNDGIQRQQEQGQNQQGEKPQNQQQNHRD